MRYSRDFRARQTSGRRTLLQQSLAIFAKYGAAANLYLPGLGAVSGIQAGNWLESGGGTVASVDNPVGLVSNALSVLGAELWQNFTTGVGGSAASATYNTTNGVGSVTRADLGNQSFVRLTGLTATSTYRLSITNTGAAAIVIRPLDYGGTAFYTVAVGVTATVFFTGNASCVITSQGGTATFIVNSFAHLPGAHLTQATTANKPTLRRGLVNVLRRSDDFANSDQWSVSNLSFAQTTGPSGSNDATVITATNASSAALISSVQPVIATSEVATVAYVIKATGDNYSRTLLLRNSTTSTNFQAGSFYCLNGQVTGAGWQSTAIGGGWFLVTFTQSTGIAIGNVLLAYGGFAGGPPQGGVGSTFVVHRIGLFAGAVSAQQIIAAGGIPLTTTAPASSSAGLFAWQLDGNGDLFQTVITAGNTGYFCAGANFPAGRANYLWYAGAGTATSPGAMLRVLSNGVVQCGVGDGTTRTTADSAAITGHETRVYEGGWDASSVSVGVNGVITQQPRTQIVSGAIAGQLGGSSDAGVTLSILGSIYPTIIMSVLPTLDERRILRRVVGILSGVAL